MSPATGVSIAAEEMASGIHCTAPSHKLRSLTCVLFTTKEIWVFIEHGNGFVIHLRQCEKAKSIMEIDGLLALTGIENLSRYCEEVGIDSTTV